MMKISTNNNNNYINNNHHHHHNNNNNEEPGKIFIGGLTRTTTKEMLENEFLKYGDIIDAIVMKNNETGQSRGFGFVTFKDPNSANIATNAMNRLDGKIIDVKLCNTKLAAQQRGQRFKNENCKIFIGGLPHGVTDDEVQEFFQRYGPVKEFKMMYDDIKKRPRGFGFITFELEESANQVLLEHYISFKGKQIEVKPQLHNSKQSQQHGNSAQFNWNPTTASIEPSWSTMNNVVATATANAYNTPQQQQQQQSQWPADLMNQQQWANYYGGHNAQMLNLNYYGQSQGYYQTTDNNNTNQIQTTNDYDNYNTQQHQHEQQQQPQQHNYLNTNIAQNQYYNHNNNHHHHHHHTNTATSSTSNKLNNYNNSISSSSNNNNNSIDTTSTTNTTSTIQNNNNTYNNSHHNKNYSLSSSSSQQQVSSHYNRQQKDNQRQEYNSSSSSSSNNRQYHPYKR